MKKKALGIIIGSLAILAIIILSGINVIIDYQWFNELGYLSVYFTRLLATIKVAVPVFVVIFAAIIIYYKSLIPNISKFRGIDNGDKPNQKKITKKFMIVDFIVSLLFAIGFSSSYWYKILEFSNSTAFNVQDPIFNMDISFFIFKLPLIESLQGSFTTLLVLLVFATFVIYIALTAKDWFKGYYGNLSKKENIKNITSGITKFAGKQLAVLTALIMVMVSTGYIIKAWNLSYSPRGVVFGASYTDIAVSLKFYRVISVAALVFAVVIFFSIISKKMKPVIFSVIMILVLIIGENVASIMTQQFIVNSNEKTLEAQYIDKHIEYTKKAYNIEDIAYEDFNINNDLTMDDIKESDDIISNIKVNSYRPALEFYNQFQYIRYYYDFNDVDIDRYTINGKYNQVFIAPREIDFDKLDDNSISWQNKYLSYTHGYGVVMSKVNSVTSEGQPDFVMNNIPIDNKTDISLDNPRIYFGERTDDYSIVNTKLGEIDYPDGGDNVTNNYDGTAGIRMNLLNRIIFALKEQNSKFLLSHDITSDSKILINRNIMDRINKIAPFLSYDKDPYIVISNDRLYWIVDGYTTSSSYPFAQPKDGINYIRNSVKVVVDAYDGTTNFYISDESDPIAMTYSKIFPNLFKSINELSEDIQSHFKYPQDLFEIQSTMLEKYHVSDPGVFYNGDDVWSVASDTEDVSGEQKVAEASYVTMKLPNTDKEEMVVLNYFNTKGRDNMVAMYGVRMDGENYGKMFMYKFPTGGTVYSPMLFKQKIKQDPDISKQLSLWDTNGSGVQFGEVIIVPVKDSLLYVEPLYLRASGENSIPEMKNVIVGYGDQIVLQSDIQKALAEIFGEDSNGNVQNNDNTSTGDINASDMQKIKDAYDNAIEAQKNGDWAKYGQFINELGQLIEQLDN